MFAKLDGAPERSRRGGRGGQPQAVSRPPDSCTADLVSALLVLTLFLPSDQVIPGLGLPPTDIASFVLAFLWLGLHLGAHLPIAKGPSPGRTSLFVFVAALTISFIFGQYGFLSGAESDSSIRKVLIVVGVVGMSLFTGDTVRSQYGLILIVRTLVLCTSLLAVLGVAETVVGTNFMGQVKVPGLASTDFAGFVQAPRGQLVRAQAMAAHPIEFGVVCAMVVPFAVFLAVGRHGAQRAWLYWLYVALLSAGSVFSVSRSAIIGLFVACVVLLIGASWRERWITTAFVFAGVGLLWAIAPRTVSVLSSFFLAAPDDPSVGARTDDYAAVASEFARSPLYGKGPGTWFAPVHRILDNQYLLTLVETGLLGLLATLLVIGVSLTRAVALHFRGQPTRQSLALASAASLVVVAATYATFDFVSFSTANTISFVTIGLVIAQDRIASSSEGR
jgi:hypothetical protein